jgi:UDP-N-acetylmuramoylalanine-D-glutamate ligase
VTPPGGVVLLSPAAPSYGHYRDYIERGRDFAAKAGLSVPEGFHSYSHAE